VSKTSDKVMWAITGLTVLALASATALLVRQAGTRERLRQAVLERPHQTAVSERPPQETPAPAAAAGERILFLAAVEGQEGTDLWAIPAAGGEATHLAEDVQISFFSGPLGVDSPLSLVGSAGRQRLAFVQGPHDAMQLVTLDLRSGELRQVFAASNGWWIRALSPSPDGRRLAFLTHEPLQGRSSDDLRTAAYIADMAIGSVEKRFEQASTRAPLVWSPDGQRLAVWGGGEGREGGKLLLLAVEGREPEPTSLCQGLPLAWSSDGSRLLAAFGQEWRPELAWCDLATGDQTPIALQRAGSGVPVDFLQRLSLSPDGNWLMYAGGPDFDHTGVYAVTLAGGEPVVLSEEETGLMMVWSRWSPDERHIAFVTAQVARDLNTPPWGFRAFVAQAGGSDLWPLNEEVEGDVYSVVWSPEGRRLAFAPVSHEDEQPVGRLYVADVERHMLTLLHEGQEYCVVAGWLPAPAEGE